MATTKHANLSTNMLINFVPFIVGETLNLPTQTPFFITQESKESKK